MATAQKLNRSSVESFVEIFDQLKNLCEEWINSNRPSDRYTGIHSITSSEIVVRVDDRRVNDTWDIIIPLDEILPVK